MIKVFATIFATAVCGFGINMLIQQIRDAVDRYDRLRAITQAEMQHIIIGQGIMGIGIITTYVIMLWAIFTQL